MIFISNIDHLFVHRKVVSSIAHINDFSCTQLNGLKCCYIIPIIYLLNTVK